MFFFSILLVSKGSEYNYVTGEDCVVLIMYSSFVPFYLCVLLTRFDLCLGEHFPIFLNTEWPFKMAKGAGLLHP